MHVRNIYIYMHQDNSTQRLQCQENCGKSKPQQLRSQERLRELDSKPIEAKKHGRIKYLVRIAARFRFALRLTSHLYLG